jgi:lysine 6-dehydrogenase
MPKTEVLVAGSGLMGRVAAYFFLHHPQGPIAVRLCERDETVLRDAEKFLGSRLLDARIFDLEKDDPASVLDGIRVCVSCVPYFLNPKLARACVEHGVSFVDLGGNPEVTDEILGMSEAAKQKGVALIPDTGLAPGLTNILAWELAKRFRSCESVAIRVGGLPQKPVGAMKYAQFFSVHGLLNEYLEDAREIRKGEVAIVPSLSKLEPISFDGIGVLEAFITSGGTSTLPHTLYGRVKQLDYKTIRYPGHLNILKTLRNVGLTATKPIRFGATEVTPRQMLARVLDQILPKNQPDMVLLRVSAKGDGGKTEKIELVHKENSERKLTAMGQLTAFPAAAIALAMLKGRVPPGAHPQELAIPYSWMKEQLRLFEIRI